VCHSRSRWSCCCLSVCRSLWSPCCRTAWLQSVCLSICLLKLTHHRAAPSCCVVTGLSGVPAVPLPICLSVCHYRSLWSRRCRTAWLHSVCLSVCLCTQTDTPRGSTKLLCHWRRGVVVSGVRRMNEVNTRRARLLPVWVTVFGRVYHLGM